MATLNVPVTKGQSTVAIDTDKIPVEVYQEALLQGLKVLVNRGTSKITKETYPNEEELKAAAMAKAAEQVELINTGKIKFSGAKKPSVSGAVKTEAMRLARNLVKDEMKRQGIKISHVEASEITKAAKELLEDTDLGLIEQAKANIEERSKVPVSAAIVSKIKISDKKVAAAEAKKAESKATLSAKQAGKVKPRAKGKGGEASPPSA